MARGPHCEQDSSVYFVSYSTQPLSALPDPETNRANTARGAILELDATDSGPCNGCLLTLFRLKGWEAAGTRTESVHMERPPSQVLQSFINL